MKGNSAKRIKLTSYEDLFGASEPVSSGEAVTMVPISSLHPFKDHPFRVLDDEKMQETVELDRMSLSLKNRWLDEENRVYIVFKVEEIVELMNCGTQKAVKLLKELDVEKGIGLIEKKRLGPGKPNVIYVINFIIRQTEEDNDVEKEHMEKSANLQNCENQNSGIVDITIQEFLKSKSNNTNISDTDINENEYSDTDFRETEPDRQESIYPYPIPSYPSIPEGGMDVIDRMEACRDVIRENISYECFQDEHCHRIDEVNELIELMVEVLLMPDDAVLRIAGEENAICSCWSFPRDTILAEPRQSCF